MARIDAQLKIRLPVELREKIEAAAADDLRSMNSEIVARLEESFEPTLLFPEDDSELEGFFRRYTTAINEVVQAEIAAIAEAAREVAMLDAIAEERDRLEIRFIIFKRKQDHLRNELDLLLHRIERTRRALRSAAQAKDETGSSESSSQ